MNLRITLLVYIKTTYITDIDFRHNIKYWTITFNYLFDVVINKINIISWAYNLMFKFVKMLLEFVFI